MDELQLIIEAENLMSCQVLFSVKKKEKLCAFIHYQ